MDNSKTNMLARCVAATGNLAAAILLYRICYWHPHAKVVREGKRWIAKDRTVWAQETGLTSKQYRTAVAVLRTKLLVETEQHIFAKKNITFTRLTERGMGVREGAQMGAPGQAQMGALGGAQTGLLLDHKGDTELEIHEDNHCVIVGSAENGGDHGTFGDVEELIVGEQCPTVAIVSKEAAPMPTIKEQLLKPKKPVSLTNPKVVGLTQLKHAWCEALAEHAGVKFVPVISKKDEAQLVRIAKACPPGSAMHVIDHAVREWPAFCEAVKAQKFEHKNSPGPSAPHIGFLQKYVDVAVTMWHESKDTSTTVVSTPTTAAAKVQLIATPKDSDKATKEEMLAILNGPDDEED